MSRNAPLGAGGVCGLCALTVVLATGCAERTVWLSKRGLEVPAHNYRVLYKDPAKRRFVNSSWVVDNYYLHPGRGWVRKKGRAYYGERVVVRERVPGFHKEKAYFFDLKLNHRKTDGVIWLQTFAIPRKHGLKQLDVLLSNYSDSLSGAGLYAEGNIYGLTQIKVKRFAAVVERQRRIRLGGVTALRARVRLKDLDRLRADPKHRGRLLELVLLRLWYAAEVTTVHEDYAKTERGLFPLIMVIGYHSSAAHFHEHLPDFLSFLRQVRIRVVRPKHVTEEKAPVKRPAAEPPAKEPPHKKRPASPRPAKKRPVAPLPR